MINFVASNQAPVEVMHLFEIVNEVSIMTKHLQILNLGH